MAITSSTVISLVAALTADSALDSLSSTASSTLYFLPPTSIPPALLTSSSHIWAANFVPSPTLGMSPVISALMPILRVTAFWATAAVTMTMLASNSTETTTIFFMPSSFWVSGEIQVKGTPGI